MRLTGLSVDVVACPHQLGSLPLIPDKVDDTVTLTPDTGVSDASLIEQTSDDNNAPTDEDNGSTATRPDYGETPPQKG